MSLFLDSDTKNLYFSSQYGSDQVQVVSLSEEAVKSFDPSKTDSLSMGDDDLVFAIGLGKDEEIFITLLATTIAEDVVALGVNATPFLYNVWVPPFATHTKCVKSPTVKILSYLVWFGKSE